MSEKMLKFVTTKGQTPEKSSVEERVKNFSEIYKNYIAPKAEEQSSRCSQCGVPYCQIHCPLSNNIPDWLKLTAEYTLEEAYEVVEQQIICQRFVEEYVPKIDFVRAIA